MHRAGIAEASYKKLRLVWNRSFQSAFISTLIYGLGALTLQEKRLRRINAYYVRFHGWVTGIKASYYSRVSNQEVYRRAGGPRQPSHTLNKWVVVKIMVPFLGALNIRCRIIIGTQTGTIILTTTQVVVEDEWSGVRVFPKRLFASRGFQPDP